MISADTGRWSCLGRFHKRLLSFRVSYYFKRGHANCHGLQDDFVILLACPISSGFFGVNLSRAVAKGAAFAISVMQLDRGANPRQAHVESE
jgi:hypothetical protein